MLGRAALAVTPKVVAEPEPAHVRSWRVGAAGEVRVGSVLDRIEGVVATHDRRIPRRRSNLDHVVVGPDGVWVIDAKRYVGKRVERRDVGRGFRRDERLFIAGRESTKLVNAMEDQMLVVAGVLNDAGVDVRVRGCLCFTESTWAFLARPFGVLGVTVCWPRALPRLVNRDGPLDGDARTRIAALLADALPPA